MENWNQGRTITREKRNKEGYEAKWTHGKKRKKEDEEEGRETEEE